MTTKAELWAKVQPNRGAEIPHRVTEIPHRVTTLRRLPCVHEGAIIERCTACGGGESHHVRACSRHGSATRAPTANRSVSVCRNCPDYDAPTAEIPQLSATFHTSGMGLGDAVNAYYAACGLATATGRPVAYKCRHSADWFAAVSHPGVTIEPFAETRINCNTGYREQLQATSSGSCPSRSHWLSRNLARSLSVPAFDPVFPSVKVRQEPVIGAGYVLLAPFSLHAVREWPGDCWRELASLFLSEGRRVVATAAEKEGDKLRAMFRGLPVELQWGASAKWVVSAVSNAGVIIGNDSGIAHIAGLCGVPAVAVMTHVPAEVTFYPGRVTQAEAVRWHCRGCHWQPTKGFRPNCEQRCEALGDITAVEVRAAVPPLTTAEVLATIDRRSERRRDTLRLVFETMTGMAEPTVIETGCVREADDWGAGYFGWLCGAWMTAAGRGRLTSVDVSPSHVATARRLCRPWSARTTVIEADSVAFLRSISTPVDVAYLDSWDTSLPGFAAHGLAEARAVAPLMAPGGLIVFDDTPPDGHGGWTGKGQDAVPWLVANGWRVLPVSGYQTVLQRHHNG